MAISKFWRDKLKTAIVTGASGSIGGAIALQLAKDGYIVYAQYNNNPIAIENNSNVKPIKFDITNKEQMETALFGIKDKVDLLVNCAGIGLYKLANQTTEAEWKNLFDVNVTGMQNLTSLILNGMIDKKSGKIINISSIWGVVGASMEVCYSASKSAVIGYTKALAKEVGYSGISVNCVCPGVIDSKMNSRFSKEEMAELISSTPLGRIGTGEDVANIVSFLASEKADFITGQIITVDGGFTL